MKQTTVRFPEDQIGDMDEFVDESSRFTDRSEFIRAAIERMIVEREGLSLADELRHAANIVDRVASEAPVGDYDEATLEEYEAEFGEVPDHGQILRQIAQVTREAAINIEVHEDKDD